MEENVSKSEEELEAENKAENAEKTPAEMRREIVDSVFSKDDVVNYLRETGYSSSVEGDPEKIEHNIERQTDSFAKALEIEPRFGEDNDFTEKVKAELDKLSTPEEKRAFLGGAVDFPMHSVLYKKVADKVTKLEDTYTPEKDKEGITFDNTDVLKLKGNALRMIMSDRVWENTVVGSLNLARRFEDVSKMNLGLSDYAEDFEKMLNSKHIDDDTKHQISFMLKKEGINFTWHEGPDKKSVFELAK